MDHTCILYGIMFHVNFQGCNIGSLAFPPPSRSWRNCANASAPLLRADGRSLDGWVRIQTIDLIISRWMESYGIWYMVYIYLLYDINSYGYWYGMVNIYLYLYIYISINLVDFLKGYISTNTHTLLHSPTIWFLKKWSQRFVRKKQRGHCMTLKKKAKTNPKGSTPHPRRWLVTDRMIWKLWNILGSAGIRTWNLA